MRGSWVVCLYSFTQFSFKIFCTPRSKHSFPKLTEQTPGAGEGLVTSPLEEANGAAGLSVALSPVVWDTGISHQKPRWREGSSIDDVFILCYAQCFQLY